MLPIGDYLQNSHITKYDHALFYCVNWFYKNNYYAFKLENS